ncbi:MAG: hypothetical protein AAFX06_28035 [Planctomycetota bacterium]
MNTAPEPYLSAGLKTVHWALICCRNWTASGTVSMKQANDLMEAIHEIPAMLLNWQPHSLDQLRTHLGCFPFERWREATGDDDTGIPDLVEWFDRRVDESRDPP